MADNSVVTLRSETTCLLVRYLRMEVFELLELYSVDALEMAGHSVMT